MINAVTNTHTYILLYVMYTTVMSIVHKMSKLCSRQNFQKFIILQSLTFVDIISYVGIDVYKLVSILELVIQLRSFKISRLKDEPKQLTPKLKINTTLNNFTSI